MARRIKSRIVSYFYCDAIPIDIKELVAVKPFMHIIDAITSLA